MTGALGPQGHFTTAKVDWLGLHPRSAQWVAAWAATNNGMLGVYAGRQPSGHQAPGYPVSVVSKRPWPLYSYFWSTYRGDSGKYPDWREYPTQQGWDNYLLVAQEGGPTWEIIGVDRALGGWLAAMMGRRRAGGGAIWDKDYTPHMTGGVPAGVCAAKWPLTPLVVRPDEIAAGHIDHPIHLGGGLGGHGGNPQKGEGFIWPARFHDVGNWDQVNPDGIQYGAWFRLKPDHPLPTERGAQIIGQALKTHGCILGDGSSQATSGLRVDPRIGQATFDALRSIPITAFEAVDTEPLRLRPAAGVGDRDYWACR